MSVNPTSAVPGFQTIASVASSPAAGAAVGVAKAALTAANPALGVAVQALDLIGNIFAALFGSGPKTEYGYEAPPEGYAKASKAKVSGSASSSKASAPEGSETLTHMETLQKHFAQFDNAGAFLGIHDGLIHPNDFQAVLRGNYPEEMKAAARYFLIHPEIFDSMETRTGMFQLRDGLLSQNDLSAAIQDLKVYTAPDPVSDAPAAASSKSSKSKGSSSAKSSSAREPSISDIVNDPSLSLEDKIRLIMDALMGNIDEEIQDVLDEVGEAEGAHKRALSGKNDSEKFESRAAFDKLQSELQSLMEKRTAMMNLGTNMSTKFHESAMAIIRNLGRG